MRPETLTIELTNSTAIKLLENLERMNIIRILRKRKKTASADLATRMQGSITETQADALHSQLEKMRGEWERDF
jgi:hypothetical protein